MKTLFQGEGFEKVRDLIKPQPHSLQSKTLGRYKILNHLLADTILNNYIKKIP